MTTTDELFLLRHTPNDQTPNVSPSKMMILRGANGKQWLRMRLQSLVAAKTPAQQTGMQLQYILMIDWPTMTNAPVIVHRASCCLTIE